ncbi:MAG: hypothetical protein QW578_02905 [Thermoplasmatales archaeon]
MKLLNPVPLKPVREWGKKFIDRKNWREYSEQLVAKGSSTWAHRSVISGSWNLGR